MGMLEDYCTISFNSAGRVMRYTPAEIFVSAHAQIDRDIAENTCRKAPQAPKNFYIWMCLAGQFRHLSNISVTSVTFRRF